jgi:hypothetical protein
MTDDSTAEGRVGALGSAPARTPVVFVSDASAEAERIGNTLRAAGYVVTDVPMSLLSSRVAAQRPNLVLVDVDAEGALEAVEKLRKLPGTGAIDFVYLGSGEGIVRNADDALAHDGSAFFLRPVDIGGLVRKVEALTGGPAARPEARPSTPPPSIPTGARPSPSVPPDRPSSASLPAPGVRTPGPPLPMSTPSLSDLVEPPRSLATFGTVSHELQQLLNDAEERAEVHSGPDVALPSPEEEIETVLPADVLASLDEPIEPEDEYAPEPHGRPNMPETSPGAGHGKGSTTSGGTRHPTTGSGARSTTGTQERVVGSDPPPRTTNASAPQPVTPASPASAVSPSMPPRVIESPSWAPVEPLRGPSVRPAPVVSSGVVLGPGEARRYLAEAIARRSTGALAFTHEDVVRRVVVRDGDLVTASSSAERETLAHFLGARGELPREDVEKLATKLPPYGRHAGAALVAHGFLRQDQLWNVLRAHAEWIASAVLRLPSGIAQLEPEPPGRLRAEPSVFGASTGAEIFVELVRRAVPPEEALERLGGEASRIGDGPQHGLLAECNLPPHDLDLLSRVRGGTVADLLARAPDADIVAAVHGLALLGVLEIVPAPDFARAASRSPADPEIAALDEEAIRGRIRARLELVDEGDYFAVLGVARDATGYEVRRAFLELRRAFEPSRILTPRLADLADDVRKIITVIEEAYEILRDNARRERYRRAIDARPQ